MINQITELFSNVNWLEFSLIAISGFCFFLFNELEDKSVRNNWLKNTAFLNTEESWSNKWKLNDYFQPLPYAKKRWYYFGIHPKYQERYFLSSTILVFLTDGEHLFQFLKKRFIDSAIFLIDWQMGLAWVLGVLLLSVIKEKFLKKVA
jgi:hypothetical protein